MKLFLLCFSILFQFIQPSSSCTKNETIMETYVKEVCTTCPPACPSTCTKVDVNAQPCCDGYSRTISTGACEDINECESEKPVCGKNTYCVNTNGSFECRCESPAFFKLYKNSTYCEDVDECQLKTALCSPFSKCVNLNGGYRCDCLPGYSSTEDGQCQDVDECFENSRKLCQGGLCVNTVGSWECLCDNGYQKFLNSGLNETYSCKDIDECDNGEASCPDRSECDNTNGSYNCKCWEGFKMFNNECEDVDECEVDPTICQETYKTKCINTEGSYKCDCAEGFEQIVLNNDPKNFFCTDKDECKTCNLKDEKNEACPCDFKSSKCKNEIGHFKCECNSGYTKPKNGTLTSKCIDINECEDVKLNNCSKAYNFSCYNVDGGFACANCPKGYTYDKLLGCKDLNECTLPFDQHNCSHYCHNLPGSYFCSCPLFHSLSRKDKKTCTLTSVDDEILLILLIFMATVVMAILICICFCWLRLFYSSPEQPRYKQHFVNKADHLPSSCYYQPNSFRKQPNGTLRSNYSGNLSRYSYKRIGGGYVDKADVLTDSNGSSIDDTREPMITFIEDSTECHTIPPTYPTLSLPRKHHLPPVSVIAEVTVNSRPPKQGSLLTEIPRRPILLPRYSCLDDAISEKHQRIEDTS